MDTALAWIGKLADWIGSFIPRWVILDTTEAAIKYVRGHKVVMCQPGIHWYWPVTTLWSPYPTARQSDRLETQTMETKDGKPFIVSGTLTYAIEDISKLVPTTYSPTTTIVEIAQTALHDVLCAENWEDICVAQRRGTLKTQLKNVAQRELDDYGVNVIRFKLNSLARCRVIKISQTTASEEN